MIGPYLSNVEHAHIVFKLGLLCNIIIHIGYNALRLFAVRFGTCTLPGWNGDGYYACGDGAGMGVRLAGVGMGRMCAGTGGMGTT
jgi:hypothetical protein